MASREFIPILDDGLILQSSPMVILDTAYYEIWLQSAGEWAQYTSLSPLPLYTSGSPATAIPCIVIEDLLDSTLYSYKIRRFDHNGKFSNWAIGSFTTA